MHHGKVARLGRQKERRRALELFVILVSGRALRSQPIGPGAGICAVGQQVFREFQTVQLARSFRRRELRFLVIPNADEGVERRPVRA